MCTQTRQTLQQVAQGVPFDQLGGSSNAMSLRSAAAFGYFSSEDDVVHFARAAMFTHREATAHAGAEFFSRVAFRVLHNPDLSPRAAMEEVAALPSTSAFVKLKVAQGLAKADEALDQASPLSKEDFADDLALTSMARLWCGARIRALYFVPLDISVFNVSLAPHRGRDRPPLPLWVCPAIVHLVSWVCALLLQGCRKDGANQSR